MAAAAAYSAHDELRTGRFSKQAWSRHHRQHQEPKPGKDDAPDHTCPYCEQRMPHSGTTISSMFSGGVRRLLVALTMLGAAALRCVRFTVASCFCFIGLIGACSRALGMRIADPEDRRLIATLFLTRSGCS